MAKNNHNHLQFWLLKDLLDKAKDLKEQFSDIEKALYQTKNRSGQDPLNFPIRLTNKLGHLNSLNSKQLNYLFVEED